MSDVIRRGTIIIDLQQGKVELKPPDMGPVLKAREQELRLIDQLEVNTRNLWALQEEAARAQAQNAAQQQQQNRSDAIEQEAAAQRQLAAAYREAGEGVMRVARGFVLLTGASGESLQKMVKGLAIVQGAFDLFAGSQKIIDNLAKAEEALAAAQAAQTAVTTTNTVATVANTAAKASLSTASLAAAAGTRALAAVTNPVTLAIAALVAVVMAAVEGWDYFTTSAAEAREATLAEAEATRILTDAMGRQLETTRQLADLRRTTMTDDEKRRSLIDQQDRSVAAGKVQVDFASGQGAEGELAARNFAAGQYSAAAAALKERDAMEKSILDTQLKQRDAQIDAIEAQQKLVESAEKQLDIERQKSDQQLAQIGRLSENQQRQLKELRDKLLNGDDLTRGQEKRLEDLGGEAGRGIVDARAKRRAEAAGFGPDFFKGIEGASTGMDDAAKALKEAAEALKAITGGATAAAKVAELEADKKKLEAAFADYRKSLAAEIEGLIAVAQANAERIHELEITVAVNAASD